ncbi:MULTISPECIES: DUF1223 domain-containing protein [Halocynthiibacter]|uniref:DUF1223 domain-containing protein n=1 Tax=Halocynthiibacter halioticoli TaxID=2986804 RepID=A0AAE3LQY9_9RHOB|nr:MULTISPECIES: DUF1223 domain-containing protein [Halocynthiibacter]MCV6824053.1 DUF1223 domain-containing protein [Halocynthiibacter halioticoli]MCW4057054.1 DUF1223 domain-containing protein [Halocynthiibacter sp. SDUM655004]MDE0589920.1 DUF1223 domain-containing protein [Halocynthiibacter sp. C4]
MEDSLNKRLGKALRMGIAALGVAFVPFTYTSAAADPVVVELYTSQGCSSCPPADEMLSHLATRYDVIALGLHVDYWDYIGWADEFAKPEFTDRQRGYARAKGERMIYTPQMVIGGLDHVIGSKPAEVEAAIKAHKKQKSPVQMTATRNGNMLEIKATSAKPEKMTVQVAVYAPSQTVNIKRGENAGRSITYANVVTDWVKVKEWSGTDALSSKVQLNTENPVAVIVQQGSHGPILAAAKVK